MTTHGKTKGGRKTIGGGLFNRKGMINHPRASTMGKTIIPIQSDKIGKDGIQMILETLGRVGGMIPLGGSGGMNPNNRYTMKMDSHFKTLGRFSNSRGSGEVGAASEGRPIQFGGLVITGRAHRLSKCICRSGQTQGLIN